MKDSSNDRVCETACQQIFADIFATDHKNFLLPRLTGPILQACTSPAIEKGNTNLNAEANFLNRQSCSFLHRLTKEIQKA